MMIAGIEIANYALALILWIVGILVSVLLDKKEYKVVISAIAIVLLAVGYHLLFYSTSAGLLKIDNYARFFYIVFASVSILAIIVMARNYGDLKRYGIAIALVLASNIGLVLAISTTNLILLIIGWKLASFPIVIMIALKRNPKAIEASLKFLIMEAVGMALFAIGIAAIFGATGTLDLAEMGAVSIGYEKLLYFGILMLVVGMGFEMAIVPFHVWIPDTYAGAPVASVIYISAILKALAFGIAIRIFYLGLPMYAEFWAPLFAILAIVTMTAGNLAAITQVTMRRLMAWSSIAHAGYLLTVLAAFGASLQILWGGLVHILMYAFMNTIAFVSVGIIEETYGSDSLGNFDGLSRVGGPLAFILAVDMFSLTGIPPLGGFWSKLLLVLGMIDNGAMVLAIIFVINSAISIAYYIRNVVGRMYLREAKDPSIKIKISLAYLVPLVIGFLVITVVILAVLWYFPLIKTISP